MGCSPYWPILEQGGGMNPALATTTLPNGGFFCLMSEYVVYILNSKNFGKIYIGMTSNLLARFLSHNSLVKKGYTSYYRPWEVIQVDFFKTKNEALKREKFLKSGKGRSWIRTQFF